MTDDTKKELAELKAKSAAQDAKIAELEAKVDPPKSTFVPMTDAEWIDKMHQMREGRMAMAMPPSALQAMAAAEPKGFMSGVLRDNRNAPTSPTGMIPNSGRSAGAPAAPSPTPGWVAPTPLSNPPGTNWVDAIAIADEVRQRAELKRKLGE
jgi:hypothetical protein